MEVSWGVDNGKKYSKDGIRCDSEEDGIITVCRKIITVGADKEMYLPPQG